jgi:hypothetical protein
VDNFLMFGRRFKLCAIRESEDSVASGQPAAQDATNIAGCAWDEYSLHVRSPNARLDMSQAGRLAPSGD